MLGLHGVVVAIVGVVTKIPEGDAGALRNMVVTVELALVVGSWWHNMMSLCW